MNPVLRPFQPEDTDWLVDRHQVLYAREEGFDQSFGPLVRDILDAFVARHDPNREQGWVAEVDGCPIGSIFCVSEGAERPDMAKLRLFLLEPSARGTGLAQSMMDHCLAFARSCGYRGMTLWTHESHLAACRLYQRNGFSITHSRATRSFGQDVVTQIWEREL